MLVNNRLPNWFPIHSGVRQGDSLSPILFTTFINDLNEAKVGVRMGAIELALLMYADEIVILTETFEKAQLALEILGQWCTTWGMKDNIKNRRWCTTGPQGSPDGPRLCC